jgi:Flp pilus assembly protein protease CpaA
MIWLFIYVLAISLYDFHIRRIPNWYTIPLMAAGLIAHFPGYIELWLASFALMYAWAGGWMGAGDTKLWIVLLWALPVESPPQVLLFMFASFFLTGLAQILWRIARKQTPTNSLTPGAWRTIPFILFLWHVH